MTLHGGLPDPIAVAVAFGRTLEAIDVPYLVGGSLASSVHGEPRSTNDVDVLAALAIGHVAPLVARTAAEYYVSEDAAREDAAREAVAMAGTFNLIHLEAGVKVDVFVAGDDPFNAERLRGRQRVEVAHDPPAHLFVDRAEHAIVRKLLWYRAGGESSGRQWRDVLGMLRVQQSAGVLDVGRLREWAARTGVSDLLARAYASLG